MTTKIDVDTKVFVRLLLVVSAFAGVLFLIWRLWPALLIIAVAFFLALALNPSVSALSRRLPGKSRILATLIAYVLILGVIGSFIYVAVPPTIDQTVHFVNNLPSYINHLREQPGWLGAAFNDFIVRYQLQEQLQHVVEGIQTQAFNSVTGIGGTVVAGVSSFFVSLVTIITLLVLVFLMLVEGPEWQRRFFSLIPDRVKGERYHKLATKMYGVVSSYVNGQLVVALIAATAGLVALFVLSQIFHLQLGIILPLVGVIFITDMIPLIGSTIGAAIVIIVLLFSDFGAAISFLVYFLIYQQIENNFIQPVVQARTVALSALSVLITVILGVSLLGIVGGILAIPIAGCIRVVILDHMENRLAHRLPVRITSKKL